MSSFIKTFFTYENPICLLKFNYVNLLSKFLFAILKCYLWFFFFGGGGFDFYTQAWTRVKGFFLFSKWARAHAYTLKGGGGKILQNQKRALFINFEVKTREKCHSQNFLEEFPSHDFRFIDKPFWSKPIPTCYITMWTEFAITKFISLLTHLGGGGGAALDITRIV